MKRNATDILRRGFVVTVANWPLIAVRLAESVLLVALTLGAIVAAVVPMIVAAGLSTFSDPASFSEALIDHWLVIVYALAIICVLLLVLVVVHAFVDGGVALILVDSERAGAKPAFNMDRFLTGGRSLWWRIFWIYNVVWSLACIVLLVPLIATLAAMLLVTDNTGRIVVGCIGVLLAVLVLLPVGVAAAVWSEKAIAVCAGRNTTAQESIRIARREMRLDFGRHFAVAFIVIVVSIGGAGVISAISMPMNILHQHQPMLAFVSAPLQIVLSFAQSIFSAATGTWFLASFISMTEER